MTFRCVNILVTIGVCLATSANAKHTSREIADPNGYIDEVVAALDTSIENHGYDELELRNASRGFDDDILGVPIHINTNLSDGYIQHLAELVRSGDATQGVSETGDPFVEADIIIVNATASYHLTVEFLDTLRETDLDIFIDSVTLRLTIAKDSNGTTGVRVFHTINVGNGVVEDNSDDVIISAVTSALETFLTETIVVGIDFLIADPIVGLLQEILVQDPLPDSKR